MCIGLNIPMDSKRQGAGVPLPGGPSWEWLKTLSFPAIIIQLFPKQKTEHENIGRHTLLLQNTPPHFLPWQRRETCCQRILVLWWDKKLSPFDHLAPRPNHQLRYSLLKLTTPMFTAINPSIYMYIYIHIFAKKITHITASDSPVLYCYDA